MCRRTPTPIPEAELVTHNIRLYKKENVAEMCAHPPTDLVNFVTEIQSLVQITGINNQWWHIRKLNYVLHACHANELYTPPTSAALQSVTTLQ